MIPPSEITSIVDIVGLPYSGINLSYSTSAPVGPGDADIFINLAKKHSSLEAYQRSLRRQLSDSYPSTQFEFLPADIVSQILNFGLPSPLDVQVTGFKTEENRAFIESLLPKLMEVPGAVDLHIQQPYDYPQINIDVDRSKAQFLGPHPTEHRIQFARILIGQLPNLALLLDRSENRYPIQCRLTNPAVPARIDERSW